MDENEISNLLHAIDTRLTVVESDVETLAGTNKWIRGIAIVLLVQIVLAAIGFGRLAQQVEGLNLGALETNVGTALQVLGDHGNELHDVRAEQARIRGVIDSIRNELSIRTRDRFYKSDAAELQKAITTLKNRVQRNEGWIRENRHSHGNSQ